FGVAIPLVLTTGIFVLLMRWLPRSRPSLRAALLGGGAGAIGFQVIQAGLAWYLSGPANFSAIYGSASAIFAFLLSISLGARACAVGPVLTSFVAAGASPGAVPREPPGR